jgi:hypothetical protein
MQKFVDVMRRSYPKGAGIPRFFPLLAAKPVVSCHHIEPLAPESSIPGQACAKLCRTPGNGFRSLLCLAGPLLVSPRNLAPFYLH